MLVYVATYPRCGSGVLRWLIIRNFARGAVKDAWLAAPGDRRALAAGPELHFVKTHGLPSDRYEPGERAIQMVRHPGQAIASHFRLHQTPSAEAARPLKRFIAGQKQTGDWTSHHRAWAQAPLPLLRLRYESAVQAPDEAVAAIAAFLDLPPPDRVVAETAEEARQRNPTRNPNADPQAWRELFGDKGRRRLAEAHGALAAELGYDL